MNLQLECKLIYTKHLIYSIKIHLKCVLKKLNLNQFYLLFAIFMLLLLKGNIYIDKICIEEIYFRRKFGAQGWNRNYPFNNGDLTISVNVLYNYLEANSKVPCKNFLL